MPANLENTAVEKVSSRSSPKKGQCQRMFKYCIIALISYPSKVILKILKASLQQYMNSEIPDVQPGIRKGRRTTDQWQHSLNEKKQENPQKISTSVSLTMLKLLSVIHNKLWKTIQEM